MSRIARVFPRRTSMTPTDILAFVDCPPPLLAMPEVDEVHVSVAFTWDIPKAEWLAKQWEQLGVPVKMGGPAFNQPGGEFVPGLYVKEGATITSRGCPNHCWFCAVPKREALEAKLKAAMTRYEENTHAAANSPKGSKDRHRASARARDWYLNVIKLQRELKIAQERALEQ